MAFGSDRNSDWYVPYPEVDITPYKKRLKKILLLAPRNAITAAVSALKAAEDAGLSALDPDTAVFYGVSTMDIDDVVGGYIPTAEGKRMHP